LSRRIRILPLLLVLAALVPMPAGAQSASRYHAATASEKGTSFTLGHAHAVRLPERRSQPPPAPAGPEHPLLRTKSFAPPASPPSMPSAPETSVKAAPTDTTLFRSADLGTAIPSKTTVLEPSVSNNQNVVFYTANWSAAVSTDSGASFTYLDPYTDLPFAAGGFCCDQVTIYDPQHDLTIWELQYLKTGTGNVQRLAVANGRAGVASNSWHYWDITAQMVGFPTGDWLDFPRLALSNNYLYLSTNVFTNADISITTAMVRMPLSSLSNPLSTPSGVEFDDPAVDVFEPVSGATDTMYFGAHLSLTAFRVYKWPEAAALPVQADVPHTAFVYENGDGLCPTPDTFNMCGRSDSRPLAGWLSAGKLGFFWDAKQGTPTSTHPFPYVQGISIDAPSGGPLGDQVMSSLSYAYQYPDVAVNAVGALGLSVVFGGGTTYPTSAIGLMDDVSPSGFSLTNIRSGTSGPANNKWGDYLTVRPASGNGLTWVGTSYTLQGGSGDSSVEPRFLWFGRVRDDPFKPSVTGLGVAAMIGVSTGTAATADFTGPSGNAADYTSSINWGDGSSTQPGTIAGMGTAFSVTGSHTYTAMGRFTVATTVSDSFASTTVTSTATVLTDTSGTYHPMVPFRLLDTRSGTSFGPSSVREVQVGGLGTPGNTVPVTGVSAVVLNVTVTNTTAPSFLTIFPDSAPRPLASNLNWTAGVTIPNLVEVAVGPSSTSAPGYISVFNNQGNADVIIDVEGYVTDHASSSGPDGLFNPLVPARILDTRAGPTPVKLGAQSTLPVALLGNGPVPSSGVEAVVLNVTVTNPTVPSFLTVWPDGDPKPKASNLNFDAGQTIPNRVIVKLGMGGKVDIFNNAGTVDVIADAGGWYTDATAGGTGLRFQGVTPYRVLDTRPMTKVGPYATPIQPQSSIPVQVAGTIGGGATPNSAQAVVTNVTVTDTTGPSFLTVWPDGTSRPLASDLNWTTGVTIPNLVVVKLGSLGRVDAFNNVGTTDLVVDVVGFYI